jgi:hypothetical protein
MKDILILKLISLEINEINEARNKMQIQKFIFFSLQGCPDWALKRNQSQLEPEVTILDMVPLDIYVITNSEKYIIKKRNIGWIQVWRRWG